jgi:hypothetical protein
MLTYADAAADSDHGTYKTLTKACVRAYLICVRAYLRDMYLNY